MHALATPADILARLNWRYATKRFDPTRKIPDDLWAAVERGAMLAPSSYGLQPWKFVVVTNPEVRARLRAAAWNQPQITDASHLVVFCRRTEMVPTDVERYVDRIVEVRGVTRDSLAGFRDAMLGTVNSRSAEETGIWNSRQVYIALGFFLYTAAMLGLDACPMEGFENAKFDEILNLKAMGYSSTVLGAAGYRDPTDPTAAYAKVRFDARDVILRV